MLQHVHAGRAVVQAGQIGEPFTATALELFLAANGEFLERFQAIGGESGRGNGQRS